jgi:hypothetical protein
VYRPPGMPRPRYLPGVVPSLERRVMENHCLMASHDAFGLEGDGLATRTVLLPRMSPLQPFRLDAALSPEGLTARIVCGYSLLRQ